MLQRIFVGVFYSIIIIIILLYKPLNTSSLFSNPNPISSHELAIAKIQELKLLDTADINPVCHTIFMDHGRKTEKVLVIFHGYTNCPKQFEKLGQMFYDRGFNVFIPRIPHHGLSNRLTNDLSNLTAEELAQFSDQSIDIAQGLGDNVYVTGISAGGVMAAWAAQFRDVKKAIPIAPIFAYSYPKSTALPLANLAQVFPERYRWWDEVAKDQIKGPQYAYPRYSQKAIGEVFRLGSAAFKSAKRQRPKAQEILIVTVGGDIAVNENVIDDLIRLWKKKQANVTKFEFPKEENLLHDIIDPNQVEQKIDYVYPILIDLIEK